MVACWMVQGIPLEAQTLTWARGFGGASDDQALDVAVDNSGNVYVVGHFGDFFSGGTADLDPSPEVLEFTSAGSTDIFISKLDLAGSLVWARRIGGTGRDGALAAAVDGSGHIYTVGVFAGEVDFAPGNREFNLTAEGDLDLFLLKLDTDGNFAWAGRIDGDASDVAVDSLGNAYVVGHFSRTADFDPGIGTFNLTSEGFTDAFAAKFDKDGSLLWVRRFGGSGEEAASEVAIDSEGNIYVAGVFGPFLEMGGTADFDPGPAVFHMTSVGELDVFVSKLNSAGDFVWASALGGEDLDIAHAVGLDRADNAYVAGYSGALDPDQGGQLSTSVSKLSRSGELIWSHKMGAVGLNRAFGVSVDSGGDIHIAGSFQLTVDFDPGAGASTMTSAGGEDIFISKLDSSGNFVFAIASGGPADDRAWNLARDDYGNLFAVGNFRDTIGFRPGSDTFGITSAGGSDAFIHALRTRPQPVNAASFIHAPAAGGLVSFFGSFPGVPSRAASRIPLPRQLGLLSVEFCPGADAPALSNAQAQCVSAPLLFVSDLQINLQLPWEVAAMAEPVSMVVSIGGVPRKPIEVALSIASPGVFTFDSGPGRAVAVNNTTGVVAQPAGSLDAFGIDSQPASPGDILIVLATGLGPVSPEGRTGESSLDDQGAFSRRDTIFPPKVFIGGVEAEILFSGLAPHFVGVYQVNVRVPLGIPPRDDAPLVIEVNGVRSRGDVTVAVSALSP